MGNARLPGSSGGNGAGLRRRVACRDVDPELFFPVGETGAALLQAEDAKQVCRSCLAIAPCLDFALAIGAEGVWGGTTTEERKTLKRRQQRAASRAAAKAAT